MQASQTKSAAKATTCSASAANKDPNAEATPPSAPPPQTVSKPKSNNDSKETPPLPPTPTSLSVTKPPTHPPAPTNTTIPSAVLLSPPTQEPQEIDLSSDDEEEKEKDENLPADFNDIDVESNGDIGFTINYFSGTYPIPIGYIAKLFATLPQAIQLEQTENIINVNPANNPIVSIGTDYSSILQPFSLPYQEIQGKSE